MLLRELLKLATDDCSTEWQQFIHEIDCPAWKDITGRTKCKCDGSYIISQVRRAINGGKTYMVETICPDCNGDGVKKPEEVLKSGAIRRCLSCHGRGAVRVKPPERPKLQVPAGVCRNYGGTWSCFDPRRDRPVEKPCEPCLATRVVTGGTTS